MRDATDGRTYMGVGLEKWRKLPTGLTSHFRLFHVAYDSLPTVIDVDVLDANVLLPTVTKPSKHFDLGRVGSQQPSRGRAKRRHSQLTPMPTSEPGQDRHRCSVRAGHLNG